MHQPNPSWRLFVSSVRWLSFWALPLPSLTMCHWWRQHRSSIKHSRRVGRPVIARGSDVARDERYFPILNEELFGAQESSKSQSSFVFFWEVPWSKFKGLSPLRKEHVGTQRGDDGR